MCNLSFLLIANDGYNLFIHLSNIYQVLTIYQALFWMLGIQQQINEIKIPNLTELTYSRAEIHLSKITKRK